MFLVWTSGPFILSGRDANHHLYTEYTVFVCFIVQVYWITRKNENLPKLTWLGKELTLRVLADSKFIILVWALIIITGSKPTQAKVTRLCGSFMHLKLKMGWCAPKH